MCGIIRDMTQIFTGKKRAAQILETVASEIVSKRLQPKIVSFYFVNDPGSRLYTRKKAEAAASVGIKFEAVALDMGADQATARALAVAKIQTEPKAGVMVQKPTRKSFEEFWQGRVGRETYDQWWQAWVELIPVERDIDGLAPQTQMLLQAGEQVEFLPATLEAVREALPKFTIEEADGVFIQAYELPSEGRNWREFSLQDKKILIVGKSDLLGRPLAAWWQCHGLDVTLFGKKAILERLETPQKLSEFDVIVSASGVPGLITGEQIKKGAILVDVGEPQGDVDLKSVIGIADCVTPVPGGVGPLTVACLLRNAAKLDAFLSELDGEF